MYSNIILDLKIIYDHRIIVLDISLRSHKHLNGQWPISSYGLAYIKDKPQDIYFQIFERLTN